MKIGVLANPEYSGLSDVLDRLRAAAGKHGMDLYFHEELASAEGSQALGDATWSEIDCLLTLGGDGTLLRGARLAGPRGIPILGCNVGRLGFLTSASLSELEDAIERLARGDYTEDERLALEVTVEREEAVDREGGTASADEADVGPFYALNDAVIHKSGFARLVRLQVWADDEELGLYSADGIIISTATGSTAYSLSAGGPILVPGLDALVTTPICPHTLAVRPVVHPAEALITVEVAMGDGEVVLTVDGQVGSALRSGDRVIARRSAHPVRLVRFPGQTFFSVLRRKLRWGDVRPLEVGRESP